MSSECNSETGPAHMLLICRFLHANALFPNQQFSLFVSRSPAPYFSLSLFLSPFLCVSQSPRQMMTPVRPLPTTQTGQTLKYTTLVSDSDFLFPNAGQYLGRSFWKRTNHLLTFIFMLECCAIWARLWKQQHCLTCVWENNVLQVRTYFGCFGAIISIVYDNIIITRSIEDWPHYSIHSSVPYKINCFLSQLH